MFTANERARADIQGDVRSVVAVIDERGIPYDAIYLVGAFGRGEGSVRFDGQRWRAVNDYDFVIVSSVAEETRERLKSLGRELAVSFGVDFVDVGWLPRSVLPQLPLTIENYDLRHASLLLKGRDLIGEMPNFDAQQIPPYEFVRLLCNRTAGVLSTQLPAHLGSPQYRTNQYVKACIAIGDSAVYLKEGYHPSYRKRAEIFLSMLSRGEMPFRLSEEAAACVAAAYAVKLNGDGGNSFHAKEVLMRDMIESAFMAIAHRCLGRSMISAERAGKALVKHYRRQRSVMERIDDFASVWLRRDKVRADELRLRILFSLPAVYTRGPEKSFRQKLFFMSRFWCVPEALWRWNDPCSVVSLWEEYCH